MKKLRKSEITQLTECGKWLKATGSRRNLMEHSFYEEIADLLELHEVQKLKQYRHHIMTTRFQHSLNVSYYNYLLCCLFRLDARSAARAGLLHDLYFYDTKAFTQTEHPIRHSEYHPLVALDNAQRLLPMNAREQDMIVKHMWPVTRQMPRYAETYILTFVDKYCALIEFLLPQPSRFWGWLRKKRAADAA
ncbi:MAG: HAD family hydrolase [Oscillospiraceae bacterium]|nr:HAD family hydrolase [Oscillospiraceae bacterium]